MKRLCEIVCSALLAIGAASYCAVYLLLWCPIVKIVFGVAITLAKIVSMFTHDDNPWNAIGMLSNMAILLPMVILTIVANTPLKTAHIDKKLLEKLGISEEDSYQSLWNHYKDELTRYFEES